MAMFLSNGRRVATGSRDGKLRVVNLTTGNVEREIEHDKQFMAKQAGERTDFSKASVVIRGAVQLAINATYNEP